MVKQYETTFILDAHLTNELTEASIEKYTQLIEKNGGKVKLIERWGKRRLAYEIAKKQYGFYVLVRFESDGKLCQELERVYKLDDIVIRHLTVLVSKQALQEEARKTAELKSKEEAVEAPSENNAEPVSEEPLVSQS